MWTLPLLLVSLVPELLGVCLLLSPVEAGHAPRCGRRSGKSGPGAAFEPYSRDLERHRELAMMF
jgi:hypothetical protein